MQHACHVDGRRRRLRASRARLTLLTFVDALAQVLVWHDGRSPDMQVMMHNTMKQITHVGRASSMSILVLPVLA